MAYTTKTAGDRLYGGTGGGASITIGANGNLRNDVEVLALLERSSINEASTNYTIYNPRGGMWSLFISWSS